MRYRAALACVLLVGCGEGIGPCPAGALEAALSTATAGDIVQVGACRAEGRFRVPAGVTLRGSGPLSSIIASSGTAIELLGDATIEGVRIEHGSGHGIGAIDATSITIRDVVIASERGRAAIGIANTASVSITDVELIGPVVDESVAQTLPEPPTQADTALYGLVLLGVTDARLTRVDVSGYGAGGVVAGNSNVVWTEGSASSNLGIGIWIDAGSATIENVAVEDTLRGFRGILSTGLVSTGGATVVTRAITLRNTHNGVGALHDAGDVTHEGIVAEGHAAGALIAQSTSSFSVTGGSRLSDNDFGGVLAVSSSAVRLEDVIIERTRTVTLSEAFGRVNIGDGVQLVTPPSGTLLRNVTLDGNERTGVLLDLGGADTTGITLEVSVNASGSAFGVVAQNGTELAGWDALVTRAGSAIANDPTFAGGLEILPMLDPGSLPLSASLVGVIAPCD